MKVGTEALLCAAQEQAIRINYVKHYVDKSSDSPLCRMCGKRGESIQHIVAECEKLAQRDYKRRHDNVAKKVHWELGSFSIPISSMNTPKRVLLRTRL